MSTAIEHIDPISVQDFLQRYSIPGRPVVLAGCIDHWPARKKWNLDYFESKFDSKPVKFSQRDWTVGEFVRQLRVGASPTPYLNQVKLDEQFQELREDLGDLAYTRRNFLNSRLLPRSMRIHRGIKALFIGAAGSGFGKLHWDYSLLHVYISQVRGSKDFLIYRPEDSPYLYPNPKYPADSLIPDINNFDPAAYPDIAKAKPIRFTVNEGETVFIPAGWWHATQMRELSISLAESALDIGNWNRRGAWFCENYRSSGVSALRIAAVDIYLRLAGRFLH